MKKKKEGFREVYIKEGMPTVVEARQILKKELERAAAERLQVLKIIHGYGSTGKGGKLKTSIRKSLLLRKKEGKIHSFVTGEKWGVFDKTSRIILEKCSQMKYDPDLDRQNVGITIVLL